MRFIIDISSKNLHIRPCQKETLIELLVDEESFRLLERVCNAIGSIADTSSPRNVT